MSIENAQLKIAPPRADREPLKVNAFHFVQSVNSELAPLFPYLGPGDIVPCIGYMLGDDGDYGQFLHSNSVDELVLCLGAGGGARSRTGVVFVGARTHDVSLANGLNPDEFHLVVITQRQKAEGEQTEAVSYSCRKCSTQLARYAFDTSCSDDQCYPGLPTIVGTEAAATSFNESLATRTCPNCGDVHPPFPKEVWGWRNYLRRTQLARMARAALDEATAKLPV